MKDAEDTTSESEMHGTFSNLTISNRSGQLFLSTEKEQFHNPPILSSVIEVGPN